MNEPKKRIYILYARTYEEVCNYNLNDNPFLLGNCRFLPLQSLVTNFDEGYYKNALQMTRMPFLVKDTEDEYVRAAIHTSKDGTEQYMLVCGPFQEDRMEVWMHYMTQDQEKKHPQVFPPAETHGITHYM